jgi:hypothetical protein
VKALLSSIATFVTVSLSANADSTPEGARSGPPNVASAQAQPAAAQPTPDPVPRGVSFTNAPSIHVDLLVISGPEKMIVPLLPELRDPAKIKQAQEKLLSMVGDGKVKLHNWVETTTQSGTRSVAEGITEFRYPVEWASPGEGVEKPGGDKLDLPARKVTNLQPVPVTFETRNLGVTLDVEPVINTDGDVVQITQDSQAVIVIETLNYYAGETVKGEATTIPHQQFGTIKSNSTFQLRHGARKLIAASKPKQAGDEWYLFILGTEISPAKV